MSEPIARRRQRAMGALVGAVVGDALAAPFAGAAPGSFSSRFASPLLTGHGEMISGGEWTGHTAAMLLVAESILATGGIDGDDLGRRGISGDEIVRTIPAAIAYADSSPEASADAARRLCELTTGDDAVVDACIRLHLALREAIDGRASAPSSFASELVAAIDAGGDASGAAAAAGALAGARAGIGAIPARWASPLHGPGPDGVEHDVVTLRALGVRLAGFLPDDNVEDPQWPARGPHLVDPRGLWVADLNGAARSHEVVAGAHVISLSRVGDRPRQPHWRRYYLVDSADPDDNITLDAVLDEIIDTITACLDAGEPVVVHCFAGESRTGLVLRAWLMRRDDLTEAEATAAALELWPHIKTWNTAFTEALRRREVSGTVR